MSNKALRIMIADPEHFRRLDIERDFNRRGYFSVAPASDLEEVLTLLEYGSAVFGLVLINARLAPNDRLSMLLFRINHSRVHHAFVYNVPEPQITMLSKCFAVRMTLSSMQHPDCEDIKQLLFIVDPPVPHTFSAGSEASMG